MNVAEYRRQRQMGWVHTLEYVDHRGTFLESGWIAALGQLANDLQCVGYLQIDLWGTKEVSTQSLQRRVEEAGELINARVTRQGFQFSFMVDGNTVPWDPVSGHSDGEGSPVSYLPISINALEAYHRINLQRFLRTNGGSERLEWSLEISGDEGSLMWTSIAISKLTMKVYRAFLPIS